MGSTDEPNGLMYDHYYFSFMMIYLIEKNQLIKTRIIDIASSLGLLNHQYRPGSCEECKKYPPRDDYSSLDELGISAHNLKQGKSD